MPRRKLRWWSVLATFRPTRSSYTAARNNRHSANVTLWARAVFHPELNSTSCFHHGNKHDNDQQKSRQRAKEQQTNRTLVYNSTYDSHAVQHAAVYARLGKLILVLRQTNVIKPSCKNVQNERYVIIRKQTQTEDDNSTCNLPPQKKVKIKNKIELDTVQADSTAHNLLVTQLWSRLAAGD